MEPQHAFVHGVHTIDRAIGATTALQHDLRFLGTIVREAWETDHPRHVHVSREKMEVLAELYIPRAVEAISKHIADARGLLAQAR